MGDSTEVVEVNSQPKKRSTLLTICPYIMANEFCERLAYYGLATNIVNYFKLMGATNATSAILTNAFSGTCYTTPLIGGYLADANWGRYRAILYFSVVYCLGMVITTLSASIPGLHPDDGAKGNALHWTTLLISLFLVAVGTGGIKPNVSTFGADQFETGDPQDEKEKGSFFNFFYFFINVGALIASLVLVNVQESQGWAIGFMIPAVAMLAAVGVFVVGTPFYRRIPPSGSVLSIFVKISWLKVTGRLGTRKKFMVDDKTHQASDSTEAPLLEKDVSNPGGFTKQQIDDVRQVWSMVPIWLTTIVYWMVYSQITNTFILQGGLMNRNIKIFGKVRNMAAATMNTFDTLIIILLIPLYDRVLVPSLALCGCKITHLQRMGWGMAVAVLSMIAAYGVERRRLQLYHDDVVLDEMNHGSQVVDMSIWWQAIQYILVGSSEVLASIAGLEFFYDQAPSTMKSMMMAVSLLATALGGYAAGFVISILNMISRAFGTQWISEDLNEGRLDLFFVVVGGVMLLTTLLFVYISIKYKYRVVDLGEGKRPAADGGMQTDTEAEVQGNEPLL